MGSFLNMFSTLQVLNAHLLEKAVIFTFYLYSDILLHGDFKCLSHVRKRSSNQSSAYQLNPLILHSTRMINCESSVRTIYYFYSLSIVQIITVFLLVLRIASARHCDIMLRIATNSDSMTCKKTKPWDSKSRD